MSYATRKAHNIRFQLMAETSPLAQTEKKSIPFPILKERLDHDFSELVRMTFADDSGNVKCITCLNTGFWRDFDNGHFVDRDELPTRWDMDNCRPQCQECNRHKTGRRYQFGQALNRELGIGTAERLIAKSNESPELVRFAAPEMLLEIRAKLKEQRKRFR
jgi:hypothetical protein